MKIIRTLSMFTLLAMLPASLSAQDFFRQGRLLIDASYGIGEPQGRTVNQISNNQELDNQISGLLYLQNTNPGSQALGLLYLTQDPEVTAESESFQIGIEYAVTDWLSLGGRLEQTKVTWNNVRLISPTSQLALLGGFGPFNAASGISSLDFLPLLLTDDVGLSDPVNTLNFDLGFHLFGSGAVDPYLKLQLGGGTFGDGSALRAGTALGANFGLGDTLFLKTEAFATAYRLTLRESGQAARSSVDYTDLGVRLGVGVAFF